MQINTFSLIFSLKKDFYCLVFGYREKRIETYRLALSILIYTNNHPKNTISRFLTVFGGNHLTHFNTLESMVKAGLLRKAHVNRSSNLINVTIRRNGYVITQQGRNALNMVEAEILLIIDKIEANKSKKRLL